MKIEARITGMAELTAALKSLPKEIASKNGGPLRRALRSAARTVQLKAQALAPKRSGRLTRAIVIQLDRNPRNVTERMVVRPRAGKSRHDEKGAWYWHFVEFGTVKMPAHPFIRPAFDAVKDEALNEFKHHLTQGIFRAVRKVRRLNTVRPRG